MDFQFLFPRKIIFKNDSCYNLGEIIKNKYQKPLIITGSGSLKKSGNYKRIIKSLIDNNIEYEEFSGINGEPSPDVINKATEFAFKKQIYSVISIGGGSVIDTGKAVAALVANEKGVENYLEGVGKGYKIKNDPLPFIAIPTTAGSGAEVTKNSVITSREKKYKKSFRDERLVARLVIVDPVLTKSLPKEQTAFGGMDAICQLIESFVSKKGNIYSRALCAYFIPKAIRSVIKVYENPDDIESRDIMSASSLASGLALANSGLGAVHGFASGIGGMYDIPHGLICAILLPCVCEKNARKCQNIYREVTGLIDPKWNGNINKFVKYLYDLNEKLNIPMDFKKFNIPKNKSEEITERSFGSSMKGNPVDFEKEEWTKFISRLLN